ncbi:DUF2281 domain-containing protein, partial [Treponema lecithinolyticum]|uniref:DUF2281 domain-containing protein n=1 Tax=Treponema lecithinolyticum TaxID=53418 RepID=UPI0028E3A94F
TSLPLQRKARPHSSLSPCSYGGTPTNTTLYLFFPKLEKEIKTLPRAALSEVVDFIRLVKLKFLENDTTSTQKSIYGIWKDDHFYISSDFDEPLEDFAEYM